MHLLKSLYEPLFVLILGLTGSAGLLALISPRLFATVTSYGTRLVHVTKPKGVLDKWIDVDGYVLRHGRFFGLLVTGSVVYLSLLSSYGPEAFSKPFLVVVVGASLMTSIWSLAEMKKQRHEIENRSLEAHTDVLTGLSNRRSFNIEMIRRIAQHQRQGTALSLLTVDIDHFKTINDRFGHHTGDAILARVAEILASNTRQAEMVARIGGDEFAVTLVGSDLAEGTRAAERVRAAICGEKFTVDGIEHVLTVSIGLAEAQSDDDIASLTRRSDSALYAAKEAGRNRCFRQGNPEPATPLPCS